MKPQVNNFIDQIASLRNKGEEEEAGSIRTE